jgi:Methyltransferase domain
MGSLLYKIPRGPCGAGRARPSAPTFVRYNRPMTVREWDGSLYDRISGPMEAMGLAVLDRLPLTGGETVIDAGCGSGRVTEALIERLPRGRVVAVDASPSMVRAARGSARSAWSCAKGTCSTWTSPSRSTRSSPPRPSTGSPATTACSRGFSPPCDPAAGSWRSAGGGGQHRRAAGGCQGDPGARALRRALPRVARAVELRRPRHDPRAAARRGLRRGALLDAGAMPSRCRARGSSRRRARRHTL